ncbi:spermidine synthase [Amphritea sp. 2_MG-2023]|jgi:spermidine synthase|uniref:spermidine synthase n=1 Tax=Amphritea TaxID=515417 RepID=UPI001C065F6E|nr:MULTISPECIES: spermidine synthase [Amphritea]MBU2965324.1 spermidine synthase [Amphritea atlantica]MDO6420187.1 spermidine synthase [Amphritea sp. 2_MG-2023]MDX2423376.1 spermidine synthase [Amphritea sp.]
MPLFEEIDSQASPLGQISLRRRRMPAFGDREIYEVKLGEEFLMSSMFVDAEEALSTLGLASVEGDQLSVVVGGLGLGYTAVAALNDQRIAELLVVDALDTVIGWHQDELVPLGKILNADSRNRYILGSFFDLAIEPSTGFDPESDGKKFDAILLDIDHSPTEYLNSANASFYTTANLSLMAEQLKPGGVFAMWSQNLPEAPFEALLRTVFERVDAHVVSFYNPFQSDESTNSVYVCVKASH